MALAIEPVYWVVELDFDATRSTNNTFVADERFSENRGPLLSGIAPIPRPYIDRFTLTPVQLKLKEGLALDSTLVVTLLDDKETTGEFFRKLKAAQPFYRNKQIRLRRGTPTDVEGDFTTEFLGRISDIRIQGNGSVTIIGKGLLGIMRTDEPKVVTGVTRLGAGILTAAFDFFWFNDPVEDKTSFTNQYRGGDFNPGYAEPSVSNPAYVKIGNEIMKYVATDILQDAALIPALEVTRGQFTADGWDVATSHNEQSIVQRVLVYDDINVVDAVISIFKTALGKDPSGASLFIDESTLTQERDGFGAGITVRGILDDPVALREITTELRRVSGLILWIDETQKLTGTFRGRINGAVITPDNQDVTTILTEAGELIDKSVSTDDGHDERITRASLKFGRDKNTDVYKDRIIVIDADAESPAQYGEVESVEIETRFIRSTAIATSVMARLVREFKDGKKPVRFSVAVKDAGIKVGSLIRIQTSHIQKVAGEIEETVLMITLRRLRQEGVFDYEGVVTTYPGATPGCRTGWIHAGQWKLSYSPTAQFVAGDVGKELVTSGSPTFRGTIVEFDTVAGKVWVTPTAGSDTFSNAQGYTVTGGTGAGTYSIPPIAALSTGSGDIQYDDATADQKKRAFIINSAFSTFPTDGGNQYCMW